MNNNILKGQLMQSDNHMAPKLAYSVNKSSAVAEMAVQCCTRIMKRWEWVSFSEKLGKKRVSAVRNYTTPKTGIFWLHFCSRHYVSSFYVKLTVCKHC